MTKIADWQSKARKPFNFLTRKRSKSYYVIYSVESSAHYIGSHYM